MMPHPLIESRFKAGLFSLKRGCSALTAASTLVFRGVVHTKVNAVVLFCFIDKKIFQARTPRLLGRTLLCRLCNESGGSEAWDPHAHEQARSVMCIVGT